MEVINKVSIGAVPKGVVWKICRTGKDIYSAKCLWEGITYGIYYETNYKTDAATQFFEDFVNIE